MDFLERFYNDGIMPSEDNARPAYAEYRELEKQSSILLEQLQENFSSEQKDLLDQIMEIKLHIQSFEMANCFAVGFRLGGRFIAEVFKDA